MLCSIRFNIQNNCVQKTLFPGKIGQEFRVRLIHVHELPGCILHNRFPLFADKIDGASYMWNICKLLKKACKIEVLLYLVHGPVFCEARVAW